MDERKGTPFRRPLNIERKQHSKVSALENFVERMFKIMIGGTYTVSELVGIFDLTPEEGLIELLNKYGNWKRLEKGDFQLLERKNIPEVKINEHEASLIEPILEAFEYLKSPASAKDVYEYLISIKIIKKNSYYTVFDIHNLLMKMHIQGKIKYYPPGAKSRNTAMFEK